jgi:hypothetical protein
MLQKKIEVSRRHPHNQLVQIVWVVPLPCDVGLGRDVWVVDRSIVCIGASTDGGLNKP